MPRWLRWVLVLLLVLGGVAAGGLRGQRDVEHDPARRVQAAPRLDAGAVFLQQLAAYNAGDVTAGLATYSAGAVLVGSPTCPLSQPCQGLAAIQQDLAAAAASRANVTLVSMVVAGSTLTGQLEARSDGIRAAGSERALYSYLVEVDNDLVSAFIGFPDLTDPQTVQFLASQ
jgi:hypothetical protein